MTIEIALPNIDKIKAFVIKLASERGVLVLSVIMAAAATAYSMSQGYIVAYGDAESHLNIAKRVVDSLTPGLAQLGGIWLPLPHILLVPFVKIDFLWRTGLAGSIVSGTAFIISSIYLFKLTSLLTKNRFASLFASLVFMANPNVLYLQSTPMTEVLLIAFFVLSTYYFIKFLENDSDILSLILAAAFGFFAAVSRYDGWFLVIVQAVILAMLYFPWKKIPKSLKSLKQGFDRTRFEKMQGRLILFSTLAFFGIALWLMWDFVILGDPLYFTHSEYSAKSQQNDWLVRGELPAYKNLPLSFAYYFVTSMSNVGVIPFFLSIAGFIFLLLNKGLRHRGFIGLILAVPFIFNVLTLYVGQSVIFIPHLTPSHFEWQLFNVRYGVMMAPLAAVALGFLFFKSGSYAKAVIGLLMVVQLGLYGIGYSKVISMEDGVTGLSSAIAKIPDVQDWINEEYDGGLVLVDDFARTLSIVRTQIPMRNVVYVGNRPYWEESLEAPEKHARWIVMQKNDEVWNNFLLDEGKEGRLYKYFEKTYTSPDILVFKRNSVPVE
jgi:hypothetical protein